MQNIVSFIGLFCKRDLWLVRRYWQVWRIHVEIWLVSIWLIQRVLSYIWMCWTCEYGTLRSIWRILADSVMSHIHKCDSVTSGHDSLIYNLLNMGHYVLYEGFSPTPVCPIFISVTHSPRDMTRWFITFEYGTLRSIWRILADSVMSHIQKCDSFTSGHDSLI